MRAWLVIALLIPVCAFGHSGRTNDQGCHNDKKHGGYHCHSSSMSTPENTQPSNGNGAGQIERDDNGRIKRSSSAKTAFKKSHPCPVNGSYKGSCNGYVIDHVFPLACGGADDPSNMQWQSEVEGKAKDKWERDGCELRH